VSIAQLTVIIQERCRKKLRIKIKIERKIKMKYTCEVCGKSFNEVSEAESCELKHKTEAERKKELEKVKESRWNEILEKRKELSELENKFFNDYKTVYRTRTFPLFDFWSM
jgi:DNA repair exonuclease SbcCD ATPase subunit